MSYLKILLMLIVRLFYYFRILQVICTCVPYKYILYSSVFTILSKMLIKLADVAFRNKYRELT